MNLSLCFILITAISIIAPFAIEGIKDNLDKRKKEYDVNVLSPVATAIIALLVCMAYMIICSIPLNLINATYVICIIFAGILGSLCGYDKLFKMLFKLFKKEG